jgi:hypothetical protein
MRSQQLREFRLGRREKFIYAYCFLDFWEWPSIGSRREHLSECSISSRWFNANFFSIEAFQSRNSKLAKP